MGVLVVLFLWYTILVEAKILHLLIYFSCFILSYYCMLALDFQKILLKNKTLQAQILALLLAMGLAYVVARFLMSLSFF